MKFKSIVHFRAFLYVLLLLIYNVHAVVDFNKIVEKHGVQVGYLFGLALTTYKKSTFKDLIKDACDALNMHASDVIAGLQLFLAGKFVTSFFEADSPAQSAVGVCIVAHLLSMSVISTNWYNRFMSNMHAVRTIAACTNSSCKGICCNCKLTKFVPIELCAWALQTGAAHFWKKNQAPDSNADQHDENENSEDDEDLIEIVDTPTDLENSESQEDNDNQHEQNTDTNGGANPPIIQESSDESLEQNKEHNPDDASASGAQQQQSNGNSPEVKEPPVVQPPLDRAIVPFNGQQQEQPHQNQNSLSWGAMARNIGMATKIYGTKAGGAAYTGVKSLYKTFAEFLEEIDNG